jgi:hypothetical protein
VAIGGTGYDKNTKFFFNVGSGGQFALGLPQSTPLTFTCGDGVCNGVESFDSADVNYCAVDCPAIVPGTPGNVTGLSATALSGLIINLNWNNPGDSNYSDTLIVRRAGAAPIFIPTNGTSYNKFEDLGNNTYVVESTSGGTSYPDNWNLVAGVRYYYQAFAFSTEVKYSDGQNAGASADVKAVN